ncbi:MAG: glycosyltransferase family 4 protein [Steroidobacteraceae bacterium]
MTRTAPTLLSIHNYHYLRGGAESIFLRHNQLFAEQDWNVVPFCMQHPRNLPSPWSGYFVDEIELGSDYSLFERITRVPKVIYSFEARRKLSALIDRVQPTICHAHNIYHHISPSILGLLGERGIPTVMTLHDLKIACPAYNMLARDGVCERCRGGRLRNVVLNRCIKGSLVMSSIAYVEARVHALLRSYQRNVARFICPSRFYVEKLSEWGVPSSQLCYLPNFVDASGLVPDYRAGRPFVYFGRLAEGKGLETLVRASAQSGCAVDIVGTGPLQESLQTLAGTLGAPVRFLGYLSGSSLHDAVRGARGVVLPSEWYENAPISVLEAYALGKPVLGARIGGIPERIVEGETGRSFESGNPAALADALSSFAAVADSDIVEMGRQGRQFVEEGFSVTNYLQRMQDLYGGLARTVPPEQAGR